MQWQRKDKYIKQEIHGFYLTRLEPLESKNLAKWDVSKNVHIIEKEQGDTTSWAKEVGETRSSWFAGPLGGQTELSKRAAAAGRTQSQLQGNIPNSSN